MQEWKEKMQRTEIRETGCRDRDSASETVAVQTQVFECPEVPNTTRESPNEIILIQTQLFQICIEKQTFRNFSRKFVLVSLEPDQVQQAKSRRERASKPILVDKQRFCGQAKDRHR
jgi:hypothetical protein